MHRRLNAIQCQLFMSSIHHVLGVIDVCAGVEAQTKTVWRQADKFNLPRLVYLNKMDRKGADVHNALRSMADELGIMPLLIQHHIGIESNFEGRTMKFKLSHTELSSHVCVEFFPSRCYRLVDYESDDLVHIG